MNAAFAAPAFRRYAEPGLVVAILAVAYLIAQPLSPDHAAQAFRSGLFDDEGIASWNNLWFGGHHLPGYSVLFPPLASLLGARMVGVAAVVASALLFAAIAHGRWGENARVAIIWFAAGAAISLFSGRLTFALGIAIALAAVLTAQRGWRFSAIGLAALCPLASPVAALFLACGALAYSLAERRREGVELAIAAGGVAVLITSAFPEGGSEPFVFSSFQPAVMLAIAVFFAIPKEERILRIGVGAYALALTAAFLIDSPMGGNATRMGALFLGPALACALWSRKRLALALLAPIVIYWQWAPVIRDMEKVYAEPSAQADFYTPVHKFLRGAMGDQIYRVEVLPVANHWESAHLPRGLYIARGWERQLDRKLNPLFYADSLGVTDYREWLDDLSVGFVAVPHAPLDYAAETEAALVSSGVPYLKRVYDTPDWTVYRVNDPEPLATGAGEVTKLTPDGFIMKANSSGSTLVRIHWTPYWRIQAGTGCLEESPLGFTRVLSEGPGAIKVAADFAPWRAFGSGPVCARSSAADG